LVDSFEDSTAAAPLHAAAGLTTSSPKFSDQDFGACAGAAIILPRGPWQVSRTLENSSGLSLPSLSASALTKHSAWRCSAQAPKS